MTRSATTFGTVGTASPDDRRRRREVLLQQQGGERQDVADVVEPVPGVVRRELGGGVVVHADQVADRVAVLDPVEPADRDAAGVGILRVDPERRDLDPVLQRAAAPRWTAAACRPGA